MVNLYLPNYKLSLTNTCDLSHRQGHYYGRRTSDHVLCLGVDWLLMLCRRRKERYEDLEIARDDMGGLFDDHLDGNRYSLSIMQALALMYGIFTSLVYGLDLGRHSQELAAFDSPEFAKHLYISHAIGFMAPLFGRTSFCLYMLRVLSAASVSRKFVVRLFVALQISVNATITILVFTQCGSFHTLWEHGMQTIAPSCIRHDTLKVLALVTVTFNAITDLYLTILPAVVVWNIQVMTKRTRLGLAATLGLSFFATIASISKIYYVYALYAYTTTLHIIGRLIVVMAVEINVVIIAASIPILAPLFLHHRSRKSMYKGPVLPTFETKIETAPKSGFLHMNKPFGHSPSENTSVTGHDLKSGTASSTANLNENFATGGHSRPLRILHTIDVSVDILEQEQDVILEDGIVPQSLRETDAAENSDVMPSLQAWDELPTPLFLSDDDISPFESR
ncbi:hypothetical protein E4T44_00602 [Aureobasidium sp. EXF-8845]|nr:hypothetical protein E4T44_00602 [Aureobasidium sp. EXF-8845]KAI4857906.1 hypothetical protein E4T45_00588 [Aureobasidium sp. EXF-8846]